MPFSISSPTSSSGADCDIAWGYYEFTFQIPDDSFSKSFYLDLRDANWSMEQPPYPSDPDTKIRWNHSIQKFEFKNAVYTNWTSFFAGSYKTIWGMFNIGGSNRIVFQPTKPSDFICTNANQAGKNPRFEWVPVFEPPDIGIKYKIYQNIYSGKQIIGTYLVAQNETDCYWVDNSVIIDPNGTHFFYYVIAYTGQSPDSGPSDLTHIWGNPCRALPEEPEKDFPEPEVGQNPTTFELSAFPNPFNPTTTIRYALPQASQATLKIFNLQGEVVKTLVDGYQTANHYQVVWNGRNESGAKVAAGIYLYQLKTDNYSQIK